MNYDTSFYLHENGNWESSLAFVNNSERYVSWCYSLSCPSEPAESFTWKAGYQWVFRFVGDKYVMGVMGSFLFQGTLIYVRYLVHGKNYGHKDLIKSQVKLRIWFAYDDMLCSGVY